MQSLQQQLSAIVNTPANIGEKLTPQIQSAATAAAELKVHLQNATNVNTGTLDFGKFNNSIKQSGMSLSEYGAKLQSLGPKGQQAFMSLANSVAAAEVPLRRSNRALTGMLTTLKNTAKWQLSSSLLHGFISSVSSAYNYAQDLNESLNNIRIVTGQNIDQMAKFAAEANKAAKALSTTTTEYTNASLIYYQQGLSDAEVQARTEVTIKMANASRQSAEVVSDQLTAIWNNFDNGTKSLEYYADVVTALGAATASSSTEIANGLEKFASVAETVGLSYEYATAALATVTATTRQSADVVGTAFKTLFARLQDLKLGETLDDGTTLGTYSENLAKVGVQIKDSSGQLKDMDTILDEVAGKWKTLDRDQQVALAKGVAGIRQYNTFMSLMSNWDFMEQNLNTVDKASGTLQEQADIYAESWEAAQNRVRASAEKLYKVLFNDEFFIDLTNGFASLIDKVGDFVQSIGGLGGVLSTLGFIVTKVFAQQMAQGFRNLVYNIQMSTEAGKHAIQQAKKLEMEKLAGMMAKSDASTAAEIQTRTVYSQELQLQTELVANSEKMTVEEQKKYAILLQQHKAIGQQTVELQRQVELHKDRAAQQSTEVIGTGMHNGSTFDEMYKSIQKLRTSATGLVDVQQQLKLIGEKGSASSKQIDTLKASLKAAGMNQKSIDGLKGSFDALEQGGREAGIAMEKIQAILRNIGQSKLRSVINSAGIREGTAEYRRLEQALQEYTSQITEAYTKEKQFNAANKNLNTSFKTLKAEIQSAGVAVQDWATHLSSIVSGIMSAGMLISSINGLINTIEDPDASGWEKFGSILTSVAMIAMSFSGTLKLLSASVEFCKAVFNKETLAKIANATASYLQAKASAKVAKTKKDEAVSTGANAAALDKENKEKTESIILDKVAGRKGKLTTGSGGGTQASGGLLKSGTMSTLGKFAGGAAAVAAAIAIVAITITAAVDQFNRFDAAAQEASIAAEMAAEGYNNAQQSFEELKTTTADYSDSVKSLEEMTKGTVEYNEALLKANNSALKLINNYKDLAGNYTIENGLIVIDEEALAEVQQKELARLGKAQAIKITSDIEQQRRQSEADKVKFNRDTDSVSDGGYMGANAGVGAGAGAAAGFLGTLGVATMAGASLGPIGMIVGAAVGAIVGAVGAVIASESAGIQSKKEAVATDNVIEYVRRHGNDIFGAKNADEFGKMLKDVNLEIDDENLVKSLFENRDALQKLTEVELARLAKEDTEWAAAYAAYNMGNQQYQNAENQDFLNTKGKQVAQNEAIVNAETSRVEALWKGSNDDFWAAYLTEVMNDTNVDENSTTGDSYRVTDLGGGNVTLQKKNEEGTWETVGEANSLSEEAAQQQLINARLMARASANIGEHLVTYDKLSEDLEAVGLSGEEHKEIKNTIISDYANGKDIDLSSFAPELVSSIVTDAITDPMLQAEVEKAVTTYNKNLPKWYEGLTEEEKTQAWTLKIDKHASLDSVKAALAEAQAYADVNAINVKMTAEQSAIEALENGDYKTLKQEFDKMDLGMEWIDFLKLSQSEQKALLTGTQTENVVADTFAQGLQAAEDRKKATAADAKQATAERDSAKTVLEDAAERLPTEKGKAMISENVLTTSTDNQYVNEARGQWANENGVFQAGAFLQDLAANADGVIGELGAKYVNILSEAAADLVEDPMDTSGNVAGYLEESGIVGVINTASVNAAAAQVDRNNYETDEEYNNAVKNAKVNAVQYSALGLVEALTFSANETTSSTNGSGMALYDAMMYLVRNEKGVETGSVEAWGAAENDYWNKKTDYDNKVQIAESADTAAAEADGDLTPQYEAYNTALVQEQKYLGYLEEQYGLTAGSISEMEKAMDAIVDSNDDFDASLKTDAAAARKITIDISRYNAAVEALTNGYNDWSKALKSKDVQAKAKAMKELDSVYSNMLDLDLGSLSDEFLQESKNLDLAEKAARGSKDAYNELQALAAEDIFEKSGIGKLPTNIKTALQEIADIDSVKVGEKIEVGDTSGVYNQLSSTYQNIVEEAINGGKSVAEAKALANKMMQAEGFDAGDLEMKEVTVTTQVPDGFEPDPNTTYTLADGTKVSGVEYKPKKGETITYKMMIPGSFTKTAENIGGKTKKPSGNGGNKSKTKDSRQKKSEIVDRYKEIDDKLGRTRSLLEQNSTLSDGLWGEARLQNMQSAIDLMEKENQQLEKRAELTKQYLTEDKQALIEAATAAGVSFEFDDDTGFITNYTEQMTELWAEREALLDSFGKTISKKEQKKLDAMDEEIEALTEAYETYEASLDEQQAAEEEHLKQLLKIQQAYYDLLTEELNIELEINEGDLAIIEYYIDKMANDFYSMAEAAAYMWNSEDKPNQAAIYANELKAYNDYKDKLVSQYTTINSETGESYINQENYIQGLQASRDGIIENLNSLLELDETMQSYYGDTLAAAQEELSKYTTLMDHHNSVLDHYKNLMELTGKSIDYKKIGTILEAQAKTAENSYKVSEANYKMLAQQAQQAKENYEAALIAKKDQSELDMLEQMWIDAQTTANDAQEEMLSDLETWVESFNAILENNLADANQIFENALTGDFGSFNQLITSMEHAKSLQEEYLTDTNKIYETNKLMRQAQKEIDKTTNSVAKQKLKQFITETSALQEQGKLSQFELEIQQAKYDLLLAEIALKEAQNAKSTVRLQRDSEGNFGYVYTADESAIEDAQQKVDDAQNALYNKGLEGANDYAEKWLSIYQEMFDKLAEIDEAYKNNEYESEEEYQKARNEAVKYYSEQLRSYADLYNIALGVDPTIAVEAWGATYTDLINDSSRWQQAVTEHSGNVSSAFTTYADNIKNSGVKNALEDIETATKNIVTANDALTKSITDEKGLISKLEEEITTVGDLTTAYAAHRLEIQETIKEYENLLTAINNLISDEVEVPEVPEVITPVEEEKTPEVEIPEIEEPTVKDPSELKKGDKVQVKDTARKWNSGANMASWVPGNNFTAGKVDLKNGTVQLFNPSGPNHKAKGYTGKIKITDLVGFDTGGYTGAWGSYGKLAMLHEKEMVLNKQDTENFLASMDLLNHILEIIDLQSASRQIGGILSSPFFASHNDNRLEQSVHIEANFPSVTDRNEIEEAFNNLINTASQYANRK